MSVLADKDDSIFRDAIQGLNAGDFSRLEPLFADDWDAERHDCLIIQWYERGLFADQASALAEALTCACFLGRTGVAEYLLARGVDPSAGVRTGLNALHWAANRGQLAAVMLLITWNANLEARSMYGGTVLGTAVWSAINEPRADHLRIIETLIKAGARLDQVDLPTGNEGIDKLLGSKQHDE